MTKRKNALSSQYLIKIMKIFEDNKWCIETGNNESNSLFDRYCERITDLVENKQRDLMLELTKRYLWISEDKYLEHLINALVKLIHIEPKISCSTQIYVMPLIAPEDKDKIKSSKMIAYMFNSVSLRYHSELSKYKFTIVDDESKLKSYLDSKKSIILLVDDYIGTGETAEKCIQHMKKIGIPINRIALISLVAQEHGLNYLNRYDINIAVSIICHKGITDYYEGQELKDKLDIMRGIENKISVKQKYKLGYGQSEALVTMCRTPNNTFPLFWMESSNMCTAPFPRY